MLGKLDVTTIVLIAMSCILIGVLAVTHTIDNDTLGKALIFVLGVIGGAVTQAPRSASPDRGQG